MSVVLDASALLNLVKSLGEEALEYIKGCYDLTLTLYEIGNAIWKETTILKRLTIEEASILLKQLITVHKYINIIDPQDQLTVLKLSYELNITYYDASYIVAASELNIPLVTDDNKLKNKIQLNKHLIIEVIGKEVNVLSSKEYIALKM